MATKSLSPNRVPQQLRDHRQAVMVLARRSARKAIEAKLKAQGVKVSFLPLCEINALANDYLAEHRAFFVAEAKQAIATWPRSLDGVCLTVQICRPVYQTDNVNAATEITQVFNTTSTIFRGWCLLIAD